MPSKPGVADPIGAASAPPGAPADRRPPPRYLDIVAYYDACLRRYGDTHLGADWSSARDTATRYRVMLDVIRSPAPTTVSLLDFGCGASRLLDFILSEGRSGIAYSGLDLAPEGIALSRRKYGSVPYYCLDVLEPGAELPAFDYVVMNGVFTERRELTVEEMLAYMIAVLETMFARTSVGLAFNVMSAHLGWELPHLFHLPFDRLAAALAARLTRNLVVRADYGLPDYTVYVYR
jgi:SAM-dependent methyltransferase